MRIYNPQNQFGEDLITKILVKDITGLEAVSTKGSLDSRLTTLENASPASAIQSVEGDETDALVKVGLTKDGTKAKATVTVAKATVADGVISGAGIATGAQVAEAIATEKTRAEGVEKNITDDIGTWSESSAFASSTVKSAIETVKSSVESLSAMTGFTVVSALPTSDIKSNTIYLKKPTEDATSYEEYIYVNKGTDEAPDMVWEKLGDTDIQLVNYYTQTQIDNKIGTKGVAGETIYGAILEAKCAAETELTALNTYVKGDKVIGENGTVSGGIEKRLADIEDSIGDGEEGINSRVTALEDSVGAATDDADAEGSVYARIAATKAVADTALQGITGDDSNVVQVVFSESDAHEVTTEVTVTTAATTGSGNNVAIDLGTDGANNGALVTAKVASDAIAAAEARAKAAQTYTADEVTVHVANNQFSAKTGAVAENAATLTTGGQVHTAIEAAKTEVKGTTISATNVDAASATDKVKVTLGGTVAEPTIEVATADIASATDLTTEVSARKTDVGAILAGTKHAVGTVVVCAVSASATDGTFTVTKPEGVSSVHIMRVEWNHEDFVCKHDESGNITLWDEGADFGTNDKPDASEIQVFALVTGTTATAEGVTA